MNALAIRKVHGEARGGALLAYLRPWTKGYRTKHLTIEAEPFVAGRRRRVVATIPRTDDYKADEAVAATILAAFEIAEAARLLLRDGVTDNFGTFSYLAPPRSGAGAIARLKQLLDVIPPAWPLRALPREDRP